MSMVAVTDYIIVQMFVLRMLYPIIQAFNSILVITVKQKQLQYTAFPTSMVVVSNWYTEFEKKQPEFKTSCPTWYILSQHIIECEYSLIGRVASSHAILTNGVNHDLLKAFQRAIPRKRNYAFTCKGGFLFQGKQANILIFNKQKSHSILKIAAFISPHVFIDYLSCLLRSKYY